MRNGTGKTARGFFRGMFGPVRVGQHVFEGEFGFPGANGNICCVPDLEEDPTHLCGKPKNDPIHIEVKP